MCSWRLLFHVERLAFGYHSGSLLDGVRHASNVRRVVVLLIGGSFGAVAWYLLRRFARGPTEVDDALWRGTGKLSFWRSLGTSAISEVVIGFGASIGREAAPKLMGGASGSVIARWSRLSPAAASAAGLLRRRCRSGSGVQRADRRCPLHSRGAGRQHLAARHPPGFGVSAIATLTARLVPAGPRVLHRHPALPLRRGDRRVGVPARPADGAARCRLHPPHRLDLAITGRRAPLC